jgi:hypothetical protein
MVRGNAALSLVRFGDSSGRVRRQATLTEKAIRDRAAVHP